MAAGDIHKINVGSNQTLALIEQTDGSMALQVASNPTGGGETVSLAAATIPTATIMQNAAVANGNGTVLNTQGYATAFINVSSSPSMSGGTTVNFEASFDGTNWFSINAIQSNALVSSTTVDGQFKFYVAGIMQLRARISGYSAGTVTATGYVSPMPPFSHQIGLIASENHIGAVGGTTAVVSAAAFTRPNDTNAYASGDLVANSTTAGSVAPLQFTAARVAAGSGSIRRCRLAKTGTGITNAQFRLHLYKSSPTPSNGDNGAWLTDQAATYLGALDVTLDKAFTDGAHGAGTPTLGSEINFKLSSGQTIYGLLEARAVYTPTAQEQFTASLEILQD